MKALSLIQPYATLIMLGYKQYETRSWDTKHRGPLAIHASVGKPAWAREVAETDPHISVILAQHGLTFDTLPRGAVLGTVEVLGTYRFVETPTDGQGKPSLVPRTLPTVELACGDFTSGRYGWKLRKSGELAKPIPCKGALSVWTLPPEVAQELQQLGI
ncbi:ASCH domain-containing protein [Hymenobacter sp. 15J16-1T3B]|uniref:ASCH domain-containing protein n=1 Tax=Hymenobacter sp. 15J16-1T3B TaxID=2886941 RepID=UPI001D10FA11|nr:ASCH domain-containing protein [Hymenobacter sp. 15J16-1T3B]MCC3156451.1 ASCH domain-containing protein [Hymenobacter sp. 15J16-1T3B]